MNVEVSIISGLGTVLDVTVYADVPKNRPDSFVTVERTGGGRDAYGLIDRPTIAVQSWAKTRYEAAQLANTVDAVMHSLVGYDGITSVVTNTITNFPSSDGVPRYQGLYEITNHS